MTLVQASLDTSIGPESVCVSRERRCIALAPPQRDRFWRKGERGSCAYGSAVLWGWGGRVGGKGGEEKGLGLTAHRAARASETVLSAVALFPMSRLSPLPLVHHLARSLFEGRACQTRHGLAHVQRTPLGE